MTKNEYQYILENEFSKKLQKNPAYSLRAFAKALGISSSALSELISGKRNMSVKKAQDLCEKMSLSLEDKERFVHSVEKTKAAYKKKGGAKVKDDDYRQLTLDAFHVISEWYHYPMLNLITIFEMDGNPKEFSKRLGISVSCAKLALSRLERLELIEYVDGVLKRTNTKLRTTEDVPSAGLKIFHRQVLEKAQASIENDPLDKRDITSMTMAIDSKNIKKAKERIKKFRRDMSEFLESGTPDRVYNLNIQLIPMDKEI